MRVLITGGAGFIGANLARGYLGRGDDVTVVDSLVTGKPEWLPPAARLRTADIRTHDLERVFAEDGPFDLVSHHAALKDVRKALTDPRGDAETNVLGTINVLRCAREYGVRRVVYASSAAIYGDAAVLPTPETAPIAPISPYGISKAAAEAYCAYFAQSLGLPVVALRYGTVYGPNATEETEAGVITIFARRLVAGEPATIYGDGAQTRDLVYVDDVVSANLLAGERAPKPWAVYNVATGVQSSINEVYQHLARLTETTLPAAYQPAKPGEVRFNAQDAGRIRRELGWAPAVGLRDGLARVVESCMADTPTMTRQPTNVR